MDIQRARKIIKSLDVDTINHMFQDLNFKNTKFKSNDNILIAYKHDCRGLDHFIDIYHDGEIIINNLLWSDFEIICDELFDLKESYGISVR